jgi:hypothetical protein
MTAKIAVWQMIQTQRVDRAERGFEEASCRRRWPVDNDAEGDELRESATRASKGGFVQEQTEKPFQPTNTDSSPSQTDYPNEKKGERGRAWG